MKPGFPMVNPIQAQKNLRGILAMMLAMAFFVVNDSFVKTARLYWETGQILVLRGFFALIILGLWLFIAKGFHSLPLLGGRLVMLRGAIEAVIALLFITALGSMALADITAILLLAPLFITLLSIVFFKEQVGWRRWMAIMIGFCGMLLVVRPGQSIAPWPALLMALVSVIGVALRDTLSRHMPAHIPSLIGTLASTLGTMGGGALLLGFGQAWRPVELSILWPVTGAAVFVLMGNYAIIEAHRGVELSAVSPFRFSVIIWAVLLGIFVFDEWPTPLALMGIALIMGSGIYTLHRERVRRGPA